MAGRVVAIAVAVGVILGASTLQQIVDIQPDLAADSANSAPSVDDLTPNTISLEVPAPARQLVVSVTWTIAPPQGRVHSDPVFRPPCPGRVSQS